MTEITGTAETTAKPRSSGVLVGILLVVIAFPVLVTAFIELWRLPVWLLQKASAPPIVLQTTSILGVAAAIVAAFMCCRLAWRKRP